MAEFILSAPHPTAPHGTINLAIEAPDLASSHDLAFDLVSTYQLMGTYLPGDPHRFLFTYRIGKALALDAVPASCIAEAEACLCALAESGTLTSTQGS